MRFATLLSVLGLCVALAACQTEATGNEFATGPGASQVDPSNMDKLRAACTAQGGEFRRAGLLDVMTCFTTPKDAGKTCEKSSDCSGECLARSRSCAPVQPLLGCNELLDASGRTVTLCRD